MNRLITIAACAAALAMPAAAQFPTSPPPAAPLDPVQFPPFQEATLSNGLQLILVENHQLPIVSFSLAIPSGAVNEPPGMRGLASMTAELLTKGTTSRTAEQIAERIEGVGGSLNAGASSDFFSLSSTVLTEHADLAFELAADVLLNPTFPDDELELARRRTLSGLRLERSNPGALAARYFSRELYGEHPYGQSPTEQTVQAITREAVRQFASEQLRPNGAWLVVAGDLSLTQARELAERHFAGWRGAPPARRYGRPPQAGPTDILLVHRPGSEQSNILVGNLALRPGADEYYATVVANKVLGGGTDARLFQILREEKGWTYGSYSNVSRPYDIGRFQASAEVRTPVTDSALTELLHQVRRMRAEPLPDSTLEAAKGFLTGVFPLTIETPGQVAGQVAVQERLGLGSDYLRTYRERIAAVTTAQARNAARAVMRPDSAVIVVVGDGAQIYDGLARIAPVRIIDVEGNHLTPDDLAPPSATALDLDPSRLRAGRDSFAITFQGQAIGSMVTETTVGAAVGLGSNMAIPMMGMNVSSDARLQGGSLQPITITSSMTMGGQALEATLTFDGARVHGQAITPPSGPGNPPSVRDVDTTFASTIYSSDQINTLVAALPLAAGASFTIPVFSAQSGGQTMYTARVEARESVTVPAGTFDAWRVAISGEESSTVWIIADGPRRIVKMEIVGQPVAFELVQ